jgi:hypothetical protein
MAKVHEPDFNQSQTNENENEIIPLEAFEMKTERK